MPRRRSLRSTLYRTARVMGDVEAAEKGPEAFGKRVVRRRAYRVTTGFTARLLRALGMQRR